MLVFLGLSGAVECEKEGGRVIFPEFEIGSKVRGREHGHAVGDCLALAVCNARRAPPPGAGADIQVGLPKDADHSKLLQPGLPAGHRQQPGRG